MYLYPFKIFSPSKDKRLISERKVPLSIYNPIKLNYKDAIKLAESLDCTVSILLGELTSGVYLICLDLDDCFDDKGELEPATKDFLKEFNESEWEISTSGTGIHIYILTRLKFDTFIVKDMEGSKSFECYTNTRHIVTTLFDFEHTNLKIGVHDEFLTKMQEKVTEIKNQSRTIQNQINDIINVFDGEIITTTAQVNGKVFKRTPIDTFSKIQEIAQKDISLKDAIEMSPDATDQSVHDAKLVRKLMYYTLSFESAWEMAKNTNYYLMKDKKHKEKFDNPRYIERTKRFIYGGRV